MDDETKKEFENDFHRLVHNGISLSGKLAHWTWEEIRVFAAWLESRKNV